MALVQTRNRDANGNRTSKTTPWGTVKYAYDKENRLVESGDLGKSESVKYTYDANGNLLSEVAARYRKDYVYNAQNRMIFSDVQDAFLNTRNLTEYAYDAFGRRIETIEYLGDSTRNLYDGFSFDVVGKTLLQTRSAPAMTEQKYRAGSAAGHPELGSGSAAGRSGAGVANGTRYRYIGDENLVPLENAGGNTAQASSSANGAAKTRSRPNSEYVLYSNGEPVAMSADGDTSYFGTDILGSVRSVTDKYGNVKAQYEYDAFGSPYLSNIDSGAGFGYCGKVYDSDTGLYDYGFRDYAPNSARFTTVDPVRDGANWFSYCMNDAVNYVDLFGLETYEYEKYYVNGEIPDTVIDFAPMSEEVDNWTMQNDYKETADGKKWNQIQLNKDGEREQTMNDKGCVVQATFKIASSTGIWDGYSPMEIVNEIVSAADKKGDLSFSAIVDIINKNLPEGITLVAHDYKYYKTDGKIDPGKVSKISSDAYVQLRATVGKDSKGNLIGEHTTVAKNATIKCKGNNEFYIEFDISPTSNNDKNGRKYSTEPLPENSTYQDASVIGIRTFEFQYTNTSNMTFNNINFNSSNNAYIGFNGFAGGCTK